MFRFACRAKKYLPDATLVSAKEVDCHESQWSVSVNVCRRLANLLSPPLLVIKIELSASEQLCMEKLLHSRACAMKEEASLISEN